MSVIEQELVGGVAIVRLNRPAKRNSLSLQHIRELQDALANAAASSARCLLLMGCRNAFCAGRDLAEVDVEAEDTRHVLTSLINPVVLAVRAFPLPTLSAVQGPALGFGLGLALACDMTLAAEDAVFGSPFCRFGGVLDSGGHYFLSTRIGRHLTAELIFTGRLISGVEAARIGLINRAIAAGELEAEALALSAAIAQGPTAAFKSTKAILASERGLAETLDLEALHMHAALRGVDGREGLRAFKEKRPARFSGT